MAHAAPSVRAARQSYLLGHARVCLACARVLVVQSEEKVTFSLSVCVDEGFRVTTTSPFFVLALPIIFLLCFSNSAQIPFSERTWPSY